MISVTILQCFFALVNSSPISYPNEIKGFKFYHESTWQKLSPLKSDMNDVRQCLGNPDLEHDIANYLAPYPGDDSAIQPVWTYKINPEWSMLVYFVKTGYPENITFPKDMGNKLFSIDLLPEKIKIINTSKFGKEFKKTHVMAADASWDEYSDTCGLSYKIYTGIAGKKIHRNQLNRISYKSSRHTSDSIINFKKSNK